MVLDDVHLSWYNLNYLFVFLLLFFNYIIKLYSNLHIIILDLKKKNTNRGKFLTQKAFHMLYLDKTKFMYHSDKAVHHTSFVYILYISNG